MLGIVLVSHGGMADGMISTAKMLYPDLSQVKSLTLWPEDNPDDFQAKLEVIVKEVDSGEGVFILADLLGGTPCNRAVYFMSDKVRLITGLSLPLLISLLSQREDGTDIETLAHDIMDDAAAGMVDVNEILKKRGN